MRARFPALLMQQYLRISSNSLNRVERIPRGQIKKVMSIPYTPQCLASQSQKRKTGVQSGKTARDSIFGWSITAFSADFGLDAYPI